MPEQETSPLRTVVTGSNRGLGLEFVRQFAEAGHQVFALARQPEVAVDLAAVQKLHSDRVRVLPCDVADPDSIAGAAMSVSSETGAIDLLVNNAGVSGTTAGEFGSLDLSDAVQVFEVNALGPIRCTEQFLPLLRRGVSPRAVHITSRMGSIADNDSGSWWAYRMSKAALNMACKNMSFDLSAHGVATMILHPGWVQTDMGGAAAPLSAEESVRGMRSVIASLTLETSASFMDYTGMRLPW